MSIGDYERVLEVLADAIVASDESNRVIYLNPAAERLLGWTRAEVLGKPLTSLMPERMHALHETAFRRYTTTHRSRIMGRPVRVPAQCRDGVEIDVELTLSSIVIDAGKELIVASLRDLRERIELERQILAQKRLAAQNAVMNVFNSTASMEQAAAGALQAIGENLDWPLGLFWVVRDGRMSCLASWHSPALPATSFVAHSHNVVFAEGEGLPGRVWRERRPFWLPDVSEDANFPRANAAAHIGLRGAFAFPVQVESSVVGVIEFFRTAPERVDDDLLQSVAVLGGQIGQAIARIEARASERDALRAADAARIQAERAERRAIFLAQASATLGGSLDYEQTLRRVAELVVPSIADWCTITALDENGAFRRVAALHKDPSTHELIARYEAKFPPGSHRAGDLVGAMKEGKTILQTSVKDADLVAAAQSDEHLGILRGLGCTSCIMVPMVVRGEPLGVISLMRSKNDHPFGEPDARLAEQLAHRAALAIDSARLYRAAHREQEAMRFLAEASALLTSSLDYEATFQRLAQLVVPRFADWCGVDVLEDGEIRQVAVAHVDPAKVKLARELRLRYPTDPTAPTGVPAVLRTGRSELYEDIPDHLVVRAARDEEHLRIMRDLALRSVIIVPLAGRRGPIGGLSLVWAESGRRYSRADLTLLEELGRRAGVAVENARLYLETQNAVRQRDEFLSIASHELKTPLTSMQLQVGALLRALKGGARSGSLEPGRLASKADLLDRQVQRLSKLVENLLDVSRASAGPITLELEDVDLAKAVREVAADFEDDFAKANCHLTLQLEDGLVGRWDGMRLGQVIGNFMSNAIKYGSGKPIEVSALCSDGKAILRVRDHGIGIAPADHRRIFERFARAVSAEHYSGLGLGLWIVRVMVEAMGGCVSVTSTPGQGSTFEVKLPLKS